MSAVTDTNQSEPAMNDMGAGGQGRSSLEVTLSSGPRFQGTAGPVEIRRDGTWEEGGADEKAWRWSQRAASQSLERAPGLYFQRKATAGEWHSLT